MTFFLIGFFATLIAGGLIGAAIGHGLHASPKHRRSRDIAITTYRDGEAK